MNATIPPTVKVVAIADIPHGVHTALREAYEREATREIREVRC